MNTTTVKQETYRVTGNWSTKAQHLKAKFPQLTDADLKFEAGKEGDLLSRLEIRLNQKREVVIDIIEKA